MILTPAPPRTPVCLLSEAVPPYVHLKTTKGCCFQRVFALTVVRVVHVYDVLPAVEPDYVDDSLVVLGPHADGLIQRP